MVTVVTPRSSYHAPRPSAGDAPFQWLRIPMGGLPRCRRRVMQLDDDDPRLEARGLVTVGDDPVEAALAPLG